jgi:hypothetical protein
MEWISVEDQLPEKDVPVLYVDADSNNEICLGSLVSGMDKEIYWSHYDFLEDENVTYWMPLPTAPNKESS